MKGKRFIAALLACIMILGCMPVTALATGADAFGWLSADQLTGYADSSFSTCPASNAVDGDLGTMSFEQFAAILKDVVDNKEKK